MGQWSKLSDQGERLQYLIEMVPEGSPEVNAGSRKQIHRRLKPAEIERLMAWYQAGSTIYQLAEQFHIHRDTVSKILERAGIPRRNRPLTASQIEQAAALYETGLSLESIGTELGCAGSTVWHAFQKAGIPMRDQHGRNQ